MDRQFSRRRRTPSTGRVSLPHTSLPSLPRTPQNPPGWGTSEITLRTRGLPGAQDMTVQHPAGEPPEGWPGTKPEWAVHWALISLGYEENIDFFYRFNIAGIGSSYYSQFDFVLPDFNIAIEVQGEFWHYAQGHTKIAEDLLRRNLAAQHNYNLIFIDEDAVLERPRYLVEEAIRGIDHSKLSRR